MRRREATSSRRSGGSSSVVRSGWVSVWESISQPAVCRPRTCSALIPPCVVCVSSLSSRLRTPRMPARFMIGSALVQMLQVAVVEADDHRPARQRHALGPQVVDLLHGHRAVAALLQPRHLGGEVALGDVELGEPGAPAGGSLMTWYMRIGTGLSRLLSAAPALGRLRAARPSPPSCARAPCAPAPTPARPPLATVTAPAGGDDDDRHDARPARRRAPPRRSPAGAGRWRAGAPRARARRRS